MGKTNGGFCVYCTKCVQGWATLLIYIFQQRKIRFDMIRFLFEMKLSMTFLVSFNKCVACHLKPVLPTFYDECKGGDFQLKLSLPLQQKVQ